MGWGFTTNEVGAVRLLGVLTRGMGKCRDGEMYAAPSETREVDADRTSRIHKGANIAAPVRGILGCEVAAAAAAATPREEDREHLWLSVELLTFTAAVGSSNVALGWVCLGVLPGTLQLEERDTVMEAGLLEAAARVVKCSKLINLQ